MVKPPTTVTKNYFLFELICVSWFNYDYNKIYYISLNYITIAICFRVCVELLIKKEK